MNWDDLRYFLALSREGSVSAAGKALGVNHTTVARRIGALEVQIGTRLFDHTADGYEMTQAAENMYEHALRIEETTQAIDRDVFGQDAELKGRLKLTIAHDVANRLLIPKIAKFRSAYPCIDLDILTTTGLVDLAAREADPGFTWTKLAGKQVLVDHGIQPLAMFKYALHRMGVAYDSIEAIDAGNVAAIDTAFRSGQGDYVHQQGPAPQQLEYDGTGHVVASVGEAIGPVAFSSLAASPEWLRTDMAKAFVRAYAKARRYVNETPAAEIARAEAAYFPDIDQDVLAATITAYQGLGCWNPTLPITPSAFEVTLDIFQHCGLITKRHAYEDIVAPPPEA